MPSCTALAQEESEPRRYAALRCERLGDPQEALGRPHSALTLAALPATPLTHPNGVRIRVAAAALNFADALQLQVWQVPRSAFMLLLCEGGRPMASLQRPSRHCSAQAVPSARARAAPAAPHAPPPPRPPRRLQGRYQEKPNLPFTPGSECSGTVVEVGRDVRTVKVGDKVGESWWTAGGGGGCPGHAPAGPGARPAAWACAAYAAGGGRAAGETAAETPQPRACGTACVHFPACGRLPPPAGRRPPPAGCWPLAAGRWLGLSFVAERGKPLLRRLPPAQVCAVTQGGSFAEEVVARENAVVRLSPSADLEAAAGAGGGKKGEGGSGGGGGDARRQAGSPGTA